MVLFKRAGRAWRPTRLLEEALQPTYLAFTTRSGRVLLAGRRDVSGLGAPVPGTRDYSLGFEVSLTEVGSSETTNTTLFDFNNPELNCLFPYAPGARYAEVAGWSRRDTDGDGFLDLALNLEVTVLSNVRCGKEGMLQDPRRAEPTLERLVFLFDGQRFRPTPATERFTRYSQKPQGEAF